MAAKRTERMMIMRRTLLALALAAGALGAATTASQAGYGYGYGYHAPRYYSYYSPCRYVTVKVWSDYYYRYIYSTRKICY
jgi:hypothetical protein